MKNLFLILLIASSILSSCSSSPDLNEFEIKLKEVIKSQSNGNIELINFEKTNSIEKELFGQKTMTIEYSATIKIQKDCYIYCNKTGFGPMFESFKTYSTEPDFNPSLQMQIESLKKNQEIEYTSSVEFFKTEDGWKLPN